jgi:hypothetical protein
MTKFLGNMIVVAGAIVLLGVTTAGVVILGMVVPLLMQQVQGHGWLRWHIRVVHVTIRRWKPIRSKPMVRAGTGSKSRGPTAMPAMSPEGSRHGVRRRTGSMNEYAHKDIAVRQRD